MWTNPLPGFDYLLAPDEPTDGKMHVQAVICRVPLGHPHVGKRVTTQSRPEAAEEISAVQAELI